MFFTLPFLLYKKTRRILFLSLCCSIRKRNEYFFYLSHLPPSSITKRILFLSLTVAPPALSENEYFFYLSLLLYQKTRRIFFLSLSAALSENDTNTFSLSAALSENETNVFPLSLLHPCSIRKHDEYFFRKQDDYSFWFLCSERSVPARRSK